MQRIQKTVMLSLVIAAPVAAQMLNQPPRPCFTAGTTTFQLAARNPDFRVKIDNSAAHPDLRIQLVDQPETADFVLADDFDARDVDACRSAGRLQIVMIDNRSQSPDITVSISRDAAEGARGLYVHSARFSHEQAAAMFAVLWKTAYQRDQVAAR